MAITRTDGGATLGGLKPPTGTDTRAAAKAAAFQSRPSSSTTTSRPPRTNTTAFNRLPAEDRPEPSLETAANRVRVRSTGSVEDRRARPDAPSGPASPTTADAAERRSGGSGSSSGSGASETSTEQRVERESEERRGVATSNDGKADNLQSGNHDGARDERIDELRERQSELRGQIRETNSEIREVEDEIEANEGKVGVVGTVMDAVAAPVTAVFGIFGRSNPASDAAEAAAERVLGLDDQREELEAKEADLEAMEAEIQAEIEALEQERTLNFLADVAYVTDMPEAVADALEGAGSVQFAVVDETGLGSDAAYSSEDRSIIVDDAVIAKVNENFEELRRAGIVDSNGNIIDAEGFDGHEAGDAAISTTALLGVHEVTHGSQDQDGLIEQAMVEGTAIIDNAQDLSRRFGGEDAAAVVEGAYRSAELNRIDMLEYDAYVNQETLELQAGKEKQGFVTINPDGSLLPREEAVENIYQFQLGAPLLHGVSSGESFGGVVASSENETPGRRAFGRRAPGEDAPGRRAPGRRAPGELAPGLAVPGLDAPGRRAPGRRAPGELAPGDIVPGLAAPGMDAPGRRAPGRRAPGSETA